MDLSPAQFRLFARNLPDPLLLVSRDGTVLAANPAAGKALGEHSLEGRRLDNPELLQSLGRSLSPMPGRVRLLGRSYRCEGHRLSRETSSVLVRFWETNDRDPFLALRQRIEELSNEVIRRRGGEARLEALLEARERFLAVLGHDLRNPLNTISVAAELLFHRSASNDDRRALSRIDDSVQRMGRMIQDLLDFARASMGEGFPLKPEPCDMGEICQAVFDEQAPLYPARSIRLRCEGDLRGTWDCERLFQVISNLLSNALKHGEDPTELGAFRTDAGVLLEVKSQGNIPHELQAVLFEPFQSFDRQQSRGLGLGLYIVREIVHAHGGSIQLGSGAGTTRFSVWLPPKVPAAAAPSSAGGGARDSA